MTMFSFLQAVSLIIATTVTVVSADCSNFDRVKGAAVSDGSLPIYQHQATPGIICDNSTGCQVPVQGSFRVKRYTSIDSIPDSKLSWLYKLAFDAFHRKENGETIDNASLENIYSCIDGTQNDSSYYRYHVADGFTGYILITPLVRCINGELSGCNGRSLQNGKRVTVCFPLVHGNKCAKNLTPAVSYSFVHTSREAAQKMTANPAKANGNMACKSLHNREVSGDEECRNAADSVRSPSSIGLVLFCLGGLIVSFSFM